VPESFAFIGRGSMLLFPLRGNRTDSFRATNEPNSRRPLVSCAAQNERLCSARWTPLANQASQMLLRKEVIQPHLPVRLPCYDFVPIASPTFDGSLHKGWATGFGCCRLS
jgi:hypothetical protein